MSAWCTPFFVLFSCVDYNTVAWYTRTYVRRLDSFLRASNLSIQAHAHALTSSCLFRHLR